MSVEIKIVKEDINLNKQLPIFATKDFLQTKSKEYGWFVGKEAILPFYIDRRAIFSKLVFTNETIVLGNNIDEATFLDEVIKKVKSLKVDMISQPLASAVFRTIPKESKSIEWGSYVIDLTQSEDKILQNMHSKHRNVVRKAIRDGVEVKETQDIKIVYENLKETMLRLNRGYPSIEELERVKNFSKFYIALKDGVVQGSCVLPYNKHGAYYLYGGSIERPYTGSLNYMHYFAMLELKKEGIKEYDFMGARVEVKKGSKLEGIQRFKSRFGGELKRGYLWKHIYSPYKVNMIYAIQKLRYRLKGQLYLGDAIDQESKR